MILLKYYRVTIKIKVHTSPLRELVYEKVGQFIKETKAYYIFNDFRVNKANVLSAQEVGV